MKKVLLIAGLMLAGLIGIAAIIFSIEVFVIMIKVLFMIPYL